MISLLLQLTGFVAVFSQCSRVAYCSDSRLSDDDVFVMEDRTPTDFTDCNKSGIIGLESPLSWAAPCYSTAGNIIVNYGLKLLWYNGTSLYIL